MVWHKLMKKIVTGMLLMMLLICLSGCGNAGDSAKTSDSTRSTKKKTESTKERENAESSKTAKESITENEIVPTAAPDPGRQKTEELRKSLNGMVWSDFSNLYYFDEGKVTIYTCVGGTVLDPAEKRIYTKSGPEDYTLEYIEDYRLILNNREISRVIYRKASKDETSFKPGYILRLASVTDSFWYTTEENSRIVWTIMQPRYDDLFESIGESWPKRFTDTSGAFIRFSEDLLTIVDAP